MRDDNPRELHGFAVTNDPDDDYRLAVISSRNNGGGSRGRRGNREALTPDELREWKERVQAAAQLAQERYQALRQLRDAEEAAGAAERRAQRAEASLRRLQERLQAGGRYAGQPRTPNRPTHVEVAAEAWAIVKRDTVAKGLTVAAAVGALVAKASTNGIAQEERVAVNGHRPEGRRASRYARVFVDDETWARFRVVAIDAAVSMARAVGLVVEAEARRFGWSPTDGHR